MRTNLHDSDKAHFGEAICPYCGVGCRLWAEVAYNRVLRIKPVADAPANLGRICAKGVTLDQTIATPDRLVQPMLRTPQGGFRPVSWEAALGELAARLRRIIERHGPGSIAFYGSGQLDSLAVYGATKLFKGFIGTNHTDSNSRLCMASAVAALRESFGSDGPPPCYEDIDAADVILVVGANMAENHPVTFDRIKAARKARPELKLIVVDPRRTVTADHADLHLQIVPGSDAALLGALALLLLETGHVDQGFIAEHTSGFGDFRAALERQDLDHLSRQSGVPAAALHKTANWIGRKRCLSFFAMGIGQSTWGVRKIQGLINLHLLTGTIGRPGCGPFSLTGQPNAMGGREIGLLSHQLPGYRLLENPQHRAEVERYWGLAPGAIQPRAGLSAVQMFRALEREQLKAIWIAATNPLVSMPDLHHVRRALAKAELVVVQDAFHPTETSQAAHVLLPAAAWGEREWISTNSERMVSYSEKLVEPPGSALPDWEIFGRLARALGYGGFDFASAEQVWDEWIGLSSGRFCDMSGMTFARLRRQRHLQWPCPRPDHPGTQRLYWDARFATEDGRARFVVVPPAAPKEAPDHEFPLVLTTGRVYSHWHTLTRTGKVRKLVEREPGPFVAIHPTVAARLGLTEGEVCQVSSRRGTVRLPVTLSDRVPADLAFIPMHWGDLYAAENAVNYLTLSAIGRIARQPELKYCAVAVEKVGPIPAVPPDGAVSQAAEAPMPIRTDDLVEEHR